jgi:competence protein ComEC
LLWAALAFCAGAAATFALPSMGPAAVAAVPAVAAACALRRLPAVAACLAGCAAAWLAAATAVEGAWPCARDRAIAALEGRIAAPPVVRTDRTDFDLELANAPARRLGIDRVRLSWYDAADLPRAGESWRLHARLRCPGGFANPGAADRELALLREGIDATGYVAGDRAPERRSLPPAATVERLRERVAATISLAVGAGPSAAVLQGLAVGLRGSIGDDLWEAFAVTGLAHLVAISGLHVTGCAVAVLALLRGAWRARVLPATRFRLAYEAFVVTGVAAAYAMLAGAPVPALRSVALVALYQALRLLRRSVPLGDSLAGAAALLVAAEPLAIVSAGFWLSFAATAALMAVVVAGAGWRARVRQFAHGQAAITLLLAPVLAASFGRLSLVAPLVNAVAVPAFGVLILPAVLCGTVLALVAPAATPAIWQALGAALDAAWPLLERIARWPYAGIAPAAQPAALIATAALLSCVAVLMPLRGLRAAACVLLVAIAAGGAERIRPGAFTLTVVDVGQGLSAVVETSRHVLVFDTGPRWRGGAVAARVSLLPYLRSRGVRRVDRLVLSHDDADHTGGADLVHQAFAVDSREACVTGAAWRWDGVSFRVLHPPPDFTGNDNESSCALRIAGSGGAALLLADPAAAAEAMLAAQPVDADVVLIPHHGSATSSSPSLVAAVSARLGIVSSGFGNRWGHPHADVVARWRSAGTTVLGTARDGAVRVRFPGRGGSLAVETERSVSPHWWRAQRLR